MDLKKLALQQTIFVEFTDKNGVPYTDEDGGKVGVMIYGPSTPAYLKHKEVQRKKLNAMMKNPNRKDTRTPEEIEAEGREFLIAMTASTVGLDGVNPDGTPMTEDQLIREVHTHPDNAEHSRKVDRKLADHTNFLPNA